MLVLKAFLLGFSVAAPVGPIGVLCVRRTLTDGRALGFACGLGAATADALYGLAAALGIGSAAAVLTDYGGALRVAGGAYLAWMGVRAFAAQPPAAPAGVEATGLLAAWGSTLMLTLANPATILSFAAMFAALVDGEELRGRGPHLVVGVFMGSAAWWLLLSFAVGLLKARLTPARLRWVNRASGLALVAFALAVLLPFASR